MNAHKRHTRSVQSSSCTEGGFFSQARSASVHGLQPKRVVTQRFRSYPLSSRCCSILSDFQTCNSLLFSVSNRRVARATLNQRVCGMLIFGHSWPNDHHRALDARFHLDPPGSMSRSRVSRRSRQALCAGILAQQLPRLPGLHWPSRLRPNVLCCVLLSPKSSRPSVSLHHNASSSDRSRCCRYQNSSMRIAQLARLLESRASSRPGAVLALIRHGKPSAPARPVLST